MVIGIQNRINQPSNMNSNWEIHVCCYIFFYFRIATAVRQVYKKNNIYNRDVTPPKNRRILCGFGLLIFFKQKYYETERYFPFVINNVDLKPEIDIIFLVITKFYLQLSISNQYSGFQTSNSLQESTLKLRRWNFKYFFYISNVNIFIASAFVEK